MTRKDFLRSIAGAAVGAAGVATLAACGDDGGGEVPDAPARSCTENGTSVVIGTNHGHTITIPKEDVTAGVQKTYQIMGSSDHPHSVVVTAAMFTMLQGNMRVTLSSSMDAGHAHQITIACA